MAGILQRGDRGERRAARGDDVLDYDAAILRAQQRALDASLQAVGLGVLAHEEDLRLAPRRQAPRRRPGRRPSSSRRRPCPASPRPAPRAASQARRSPPGAGSHAWRRRSTARSAPLVKVTSPITSACSRSSSIELARRAPSRFAKRSSRRPSWGSNLALCSRRSPSYCAWRRSSLCLIVVVSFVAVRRRPDDDASGATAAKLFNAPAPPSPQSQRGHPAKRQARTPSHKTIDEAAGELHLAVLGSSQARAANGRPWRAAAARAARLRLRARLHRTHDRVRA